MRRQTGIQCAGALAGLALLATSPTVAGVVYEIDVTDHEQSPPRQESLEMSVEGPSLTMDILPSGDRESGRGKMIFRGDRGENGEVVIVDDDQKTYYVMDDASIRAMAGQVGAAMGAMEETLKNLPKDQRDQIEKAMKEHGGAMGGMGGGTSRSKPELQPTSERATKNGYPCVKYVVWQDGRKIREIWTTDWSNVEGGGEARDAFRGLGNFFEAMWEAMPELPGGAGPFGGEDPFSELNLENGFPVVVTGFGEDGDVDDESKLRSSRRQRLDPSAFEPPAGYKRMSMGPE